MNHAQIIDALGDLDRGLVAKRTGLQESNLAAFVTGKKALGIAACKSLARMMPGETNHVALFVRGQTVAMKGMDPPQALRRTGHIMRVLQGEDLAAATDGELVAALEELGDVAGQKMEEGKENAMTKTRGAMEALGRDGSGRKVTKRYDAGRGDSTATKATKATGRDALGRKIDKKFKF